MLKPEFKEKSIRSFVIRGGRMTAGQEAALEALWPRYGLHLSAGTHATAAIFASGQPVVVEIGFGMGDSLLAMAEAASHTQFIGIEVHPPGVGRLLNEADKRGLTNLRVFMADATDALVDCFPDASLDRIQIFFPDPWHKKKHHKRRIIQPDFVAILAQKLRPQGILHLATDWQAYAEAMVEVLAENPCLRNLQTGESPYSARPDYRPKTKFEQRGERLGHGVWDLLYAKHTI